MKILRIFAAFTCIVLILACTTEDRSSSVVVYTSVDQVYSEPVFKSFEEKTGIQVLPVYDVEAAKTTGLVNRLIAEKDRPQADVFWNGEFAQTILLKERGVLASYQSPNATDIPDHYQDSEHFWTAIAGRARVLLVNTELVQPTDYPKSLFDLTEVNQPGERIGIAYPLFGTSATHAAALYAALGAARAKTFYARLKDLGVRVVDGNSVVRDLVANGQLAIGLTDTDDACGALRKGAPVALIFPDQMPEGLGTLIIPGTVALIANGPHPDEGRALIDFLVSREVEEMLMASNWSQIPLRSPNPGSSCISEEEIKGMTVGFTDIFSKMERSKEELREIFVR